MDLAVLESNSNTLWEQAVTSLSLLYESCVANLLRPQLLQAINTFKTLYLQRPLLIVLTLLIAGTIVEI